MARTRAGTESGWSSGAERALGNLQLGLDVLTILASMVLAASLQLTLRPLIPSLRAVPHFAEAHNEYLQLAAEGGVLVCVPIVAALVVFVAGVRRRFREAPKDGTTYWLRVGAVIGLLCIALQSLVEFSLQMPGNAVLFALLAAIAIHRSPHLVPRRAPID